MKNLRQGNPGRAIAPDQCLGGSMRERYARLPGEPRLVSCAYSAGAASLERGAKGSPTQVRRKLAGQQADAGGQQQEQHHAVEMKIAQPPIGAGAEP